MLLLVFLIPFKTFVVPTFDRSHAPRGNADDTAPAVRDAERHPRRSHGDRGNDINDERSAWECRQHRSGGA